MTIVPDRDEPGESGVRVTAAVLHNLAASVRIATLPMEFKATRGDDVRDLLKKHGGEQLLRQAIEEAVEWIPPAADEPGDVPSIISSQGRTEKSNAQRFRKAHGADVRWCDPWGKWLIWDGRRWAIDQECKVDALAKQVTQSLWQEMGQFAPSGTKDDALVRATSSFCKSSNSAFGVRNLLSLAKSEPEIAILSSVLDSNPWKLNTLKGTIDLRTGQLLPHRRSDFLTKLAPVEFSRDAECPRWKAFLREVFDGNDELVEFIKRAAGYSLTGSTRERCLFFLHGSGCNGKSTFTAILQSVLGEYAMQINSAMLMASKTEQHPTEMCDLAGRHMAISCEIESGRRFAESRIKQLTGGEDKLKGRRMREDFWEFPAQFKLWVTGNHKPRIRGTDDGIWDRIKLIPFNVRFENPDKTLAAKLQAERPGILRWALEGSLKWQTSGLDEPTEVAVATAAYRDVMDTLGKFIEDCCDVATEHRVKCAQLNSAYKTWCARNGEYQMRRSDFVEEVAGRFTRKKSDGWWYQGLKLKYAESETNEAEF